jgi:hypothetical protein
MRDDGHGGRLQVGAGLGRGVGSYMFTCAIALAWHEEEYSAVEHYCGCEKQG